MSQYLTKMKLLAAFYLVFFADSGLYTLVSQTKSRGDVMDVGHIIVGVLTTAAAIWLVWAEMHSRRNQVRQRAPETVDPGVQNSTETQRKAAARTNWNGR